MHNAKYAGTTSELASMGDAHLALSTMPIMLAPHLNKQVWGCTFGIAHNANYAGTTSELASMGNAFLALFTMPNLHF